jgi:hypothetical protein
MRVESRHSKYKKAICTSTSNFSCLPEILYCVPGFEELFPSVAIPKTEIRLLYLGDVILEKVLLYINYAFHITILR